MITEGIVNIAVDYVMVIYAGLVLFKHKRNTVTRWKKKR